MFRYAKNKMKTKNGVPDLKIADNMMASSSRDKAKALNDCFSSVFTQEDTSKIPDFPRATYNEPIFYITITKEEVRRN